MNAVQMLRDDVRGGMRQIRRHPGLSALVLTALALCIGANSAVFSVVHTALIDPYGYPESDRVVNIGMVWEKGPFGAMVQEISPPSYLDIAESAQSFEAVGFVDASGKADLHLGDRTERLSVARVTPGVWQVARISPRLGRVFDTTDVRQGQEQVVVLSHDLWARAFGGQASVLGRTLRIDDQSYDVIGVMPAGFSLVDNTAQLWVPKTFSEGERSESARGWSAFQAVGRLRPGVSLAQAEHELAALHEALLRDRPEQRERAEMLGARYGAARLGDWVGDRSAGSMLVSVQVAAALILLVGCLNVGGVLLVRGRRRATELALRQAVGATRIRIAVQLLVETLILFAFGAVLGVLVAKAGVAVVPRLLDSEEWLRYGRPPALDGTVLLVTLAGSLLVGLVAGCFPALTALSDQHVAGARAGHSGRSRRGPWRWVHGAHVAVQLGACVVLLAGTLAAIGNVRGLLQRGFGVTTTSRVLARTALPEYRYGDQSWDVAEQKVGTFKMRALRQLQAIPELRSVTFSSRVPLSREHMKFGLQVEGYTPQPGEFVVAIPYGVGPDYFQVVGTPVLRGRGLTDGDTSTSQRVAVVSEGLARQYLPGREPIGARISFAQQDWTIVGVVADALDIPLSMSDAHSLYLPHTQWSGRAVNSEVSFIARTARPGTAAGASILAAFRRIDPQLDVDVSSMADVQRRAIVTQRAPTWVGAAFASLAVLLSGLGVYGLMAYSVSQRTSEIGVRMALGATQRSVLGLVLSSISGLALIGIALGTGVALSLARWIDPLLTTIDATSPAFSGTAAGIVAGVTLLGSLMPAVRAARVDPSSALRAE